MPPAELKVLQVGRQSVGASAFVQRMLAALQGGLLGQPVHHMAGMGMGDGQIPFLASETWQVPAMVIIDVWKTTPFMGLLLLAGLQLIPKDLYEAADVDGAGRLRQFWSVTLPLLRPTIAVALVFRTLDAIRVFDLFQIVLAQKKYSMASYAYYELINGQRMGYSSAASVVIFVVITIFAIGYIRLLGVDND